MGFAMVEVVCHASKPHCNVEWLKDIDITGFCLSSVDYPWAKLVNFAISYLQIAPEKENYNLAIGYTQEKDACKKENINQT